MCLFDLCIEAYSYQARSTIQFDNTVLIIVCFILAMALGMGIGYMNGYDDGRRSRGR